MRLSCHYTDEIGSIQDAEMQAAVTELREEIPQELINGSIDK
jgi:hypothetical protein